jgi:hypothetical protein
VGKQPAFNDGAAPGELLPRGKIVMTKERGSAERQPVSGGWTPAMMDVGERPGGSGRYRGLASLISKGVRGDVGGLSVW